MAAKKRTKRRTMFQETWRRLLKNKGAVIGMAFLALLLMSLYEPEEESGKKACRLHSVKPRPWVDNEYIRYAADMNVALGYYNCLDDWQGDGNFPRRRKRRFSPSYGNYPRR